MKSLLHVQNKLDNLVLDATMRSAVMAATVAVAIAPKLSLPSSQVANPSVFFADMHMSTIVSKISDVNEAIVFDVRFADQLVRKIWLARYNAAFPTRISATSECFFESLFKINEVISATEQELLSKYQVVIFELAAIIDAAFEQ